MNGIVLPGSAHLYSWRWRYVTYSNSGCYVKTIESGTSEWDKVESMRCCAYCVHSELKVMRLFNEMLGGANIPIACITAFYNPTLTSSFVNAWNINNQRFASDPSLFNSKVMKTFAKEREWILSEYEEKVRFYGWNNALRVPILPCMSS